MQAAQAAQGINPTTIPFIHQQNESQMQSAFKDVKRSDILRYIALDMVDPILNLERVNGEIDKEDEDEFALTILVNVALELRVRARATLEAMGFVIIGVLDQAAVIQMAAQLNVIID